MNLGFENLENGYKILMPKEIITAKRIGYIITTGITHGLKQKNQTPNIRYWTYHHDSEHYAIVLINGKILNELDF